MVHGSWFGIRVQGLGFGVQALRFRDLSIRFGVWGLGLRAWN